MQDDTNTTVSALKVRVRKFVHDRAWERYHNPKDIAESICIEAAELLERFQWATAQEALTWKNEPAKVDAIKEEVADIIIYCLSLANVMNIDLAEAVLKKLANNERKYPAEKYRGRDFLKLSKNELMTNSR